MYAGEQFPGGEVFSIMHSCDRYSALNIKLLEPLAQGASRFEKLLAPQNPLAPNFFK